MKIYLILLPLLFAITQTGLCQWIVYTPANTKGVEGTMVSSGLAASDGKLWFGTDQGVACFNPEYSIWINYNTHNSLANNFVYRVFEDNAGSIWVATNGGGVSRFSDNTWNNFTVNDGLSYNVVRAISQSPDNTLWFGTYGHGICSYNPGTGFKKHPAGAIANAYVLSILALSDDTILIGTLNEGLMILANDSVLSLKNSNELAGKKVFSIFRAHNNSVWIGTDHGAQQFDPLEATVFSCPDSLTGKPVYAICESPDHTLVFSSDTKIYTLKNGSWSTFMPDILESSTAFYSAFYDKEGIGWFGSSNQGLFKNSGTNWYNFYNSTGLDEAYYLTDMCEDKNHNLWFSSYRHIYRFDGQNWNNITKNKNLNNDYIGNIIADRDGNIWFTSGNNGLYKYDGTTFTNFSRTACFDNGYLISLVLGPDGTIWTATSSNGIYNYNGSQWTRISTEGIIGSDIRKMAFYPDGRLAVSSTYAQIFVYDGETWKTDNNLAGGYYYIMDMAIDAEGYIWFATSNGLIKYKDSNTQIYFNSTDEMNYFTFVQADAHGQIWTGRYDYGLLQYSGNSWMATSRSDGLSSNYVKDILFDSRGRTWVLADNGINMSADFTLIEEPAPIPEVKIAFFPNPFSESFDMKYSSITEGFADIHFFGADGRLVKQYNHQKIDIGDNTLHFETENWPDGVLFCRFILAGSYENSKLLKVSTH